jgi:hypothetical protein
VSFSDGYQGKYLGASWYSSLSYRNRDKVELTNPCPARLFYQTLTKV